MSDFYTDSKEMLCGFCDGSGEGLFDGQICFFCADSRKAYNSYGHSEEDRLEE